MGKSRPVAHTLMVVPQDAQGSPGGTGGGGRDKTSPSHNMQTQDAAKGMLSCTNFSHPPAQQSTTGMNTPNQGVQAVEIESVRGRKGVQE